MPEHEVISPDGTTIRAWRTDSGGPAVLLCGGLGMVPEIVPALGLAPDAVQLHGWAHRGLLGSAKPSDSDRIGLADHVADAVAVLDAAGVERCVVFGWSIGVTIAAELAARYPDRVGGLLIAAGVPGDPFEAAFGALGRTTLSPTLRRALTAGGAGLLRRGGPLLNAVLHRAPTTEFATAVAWCCGVLSPSVGREVVTRFLAHEWQWFFTLALALGRTTRRDLTGISCPTTLLAGRYDMLSDPASVAAAVAPLPQARVRVLAATHLLPLERPDVVAEELRLLVARAAAVRRALTDAEPD